MEHKCFVESCEVVADIPVKYAPQEIWSCDGHWPTAYAEFKGKKPQNANLHLVKQYYTKRDGSRGKISVGKASEIDNRRVSKDDNMTVINKVTGKEAQY